MAKRELKVTLETVTPMFLGGANQQPELRAASFRGAMRFWLRAMLGGVYGDNLGKIKAKEAGVFGDTNRASAVVVRTHGAYQRSTRAEQKVLPDEAKYLYWPLTLSRNKERECIVVNSKFEVNLHLRVGLLTADLLWQAGAALWLTIRLGGLGTRSRRTLGSLIATNEKLPELSNPIPTFVSEAQTLENAAQEIQQGWDSIKSVLGQPKAVPAQQFCTLAKDVCRIAVVGEASSWDSWQVAAEKMGVALQQFRRTIKPCYKRRGLGLPLKRNCDRNPPYKRYASPLLLSVIPLQSGLYAGITVMFKPQLETVSLSHFDGFLREFERYEEIAL